LKTTKIERRRTIMSKIINSTLHSEVAATKLVAGILPSRGVHALTGTDAQTNLAIAADLAVALAAGPIGCGLGLPDAKGVRTSLAGFFGQLAAGPCGVALIAPGSPAATIAAGRPPLWPEA
jgi:hypothetical protein